MRIVTKDKIYILNRSSLTFGYTIYTKATDERRSYYLQLSTEDPWWIPKRDTMSDGKVTLWGWLFFYVGCLTDMLD